MHRLHTHGPARAVRLHSADILFYAQSAVESAALMLRAGLEAQQGEFSVHAITNLGFPVNLLDIALGVLVQTGSSAPIYFSGYERGFEPMPFPGLYDPATAGDLSPLVSAFEAGGVRRSENSFTENFPLAFAHNPESLNRLLALERSCQASGDQDSIYNALDNLSWSLLDSFLQVVPTKVLNRSSRLSQPHQESLSPEHRRVLAAVSRYASAG